MIESRPQCYPTPFCIMLSSNDMTVVPVLPPLQALKHKISSSIVGFVIGMAPLCTVVLSPIFGFFVSL